MVSMTRKAIIGALALGLVTAGAAVAQDQRGQDQRSQDQRGWGNNGWGQNNNNNNGHGWNQERAEATLFREMNFRGTPVVLRGENANINISWNPRSVRVQSGRWELCEQPNFRGNCQTVERDTPMLGGLRGGVIRSARPLNTGGNDGWNSGAQGQTLRGNSAQFYTQPADRGRRIEACDRGSPNASCTQRTADNFCRQEGWTRAAHADSDRSGRRAYLSDVLCVRTQR